MEGKGSGPLVLAVDLGGTQLRVATVRDGTVAARRDVPTPQGGPLPVVRRITALAAELGGSPLAAGVAAPGPLDPASGAMYATPNLVGFDGFALAAAIADAIGLPVFVNNDANLAALGEWHFGAGRGADLLVFLTVSTGVGGGVIRGGQIDAGRHGLAAELGHVVVAAGGPACNLGHRGCLEGLASGTSLAARASEAVAGGESTLMVELADNGRITARVVAAAANAGDRVAMRLMDDLGRYLGLAVGSFVNVFDPSAVVIGGGVSGAWPLFEAALLAAADEVIMSRAARPALRVLRAERPGDAGLLGAAVYAAAQARA